jgi:type III secretion protein R
VRFLRENARPSDRAFFVDLAHRSRASQRTHGAAALDAPAADDVAVLLPAFVVSELTRAFLIAFLLLLPFLVVDVVVANVLVALGLHTMSPASVALPFKLLLFVMADGWHLLARALVLAYR